MKALKGFRATDISLMVLLFFHAICAIITGTLLPQIIKEFSIDYATAGSIETLRSYAILFRACLETHLSIMKRFNSMLAMAI